MLLLVPVLIGLFLAVNMGASGTAPAFAAPYGAGLVQREKIPGLFGVFVLLGAVLAGHKVVRTLAGEIVPAPAMNTGLVSVVLLSIALSLFFANLLRVPQSTSQSTVLALVGSAVYLGNLESHKLLVWIVPSWVALPLVSFGVTYVFGRYFYRPMKKTEVVDFDQVALHPFWKYITVGCACYAAFSIGSNNVANAAGPLVSLLANAYHVGPHEPAFTLLSLLTIVVVAPWFGIGSSLMGERVLRTASHEIVHFGPLGASFVSLLSSTLLLLASVGGGIPVAEVQLKTAGIIAIGSVKAGFKETFTRTAVPRVLAVWVVAPLFAFACAYGLTALADALGWLR
jgi:phosphate/sulfate permease